MSNPSHRDESPTPHGPLPAAISRRQALIEGAELVIAASLASACGGSPMASTASCMQNPSGMMVAGAEALAVGSVMSVSVSGQTFFVARDSGGFMALSAACPHAGCTVGFTAADKTFDCPCHLSAFSIDGSVLKGPATQPLPHVLLCRNSSGQLVLDSSLAVPTTDRLK